MIKRSPPDIEKLETVRQLFGVLAKATDEWDAFLATWGQVDLPEQGKFLPPHGRFYEHPAQQIAALCFQALGAGEEFRNAVAEKNPNRALFDLAITFEPNVSLEELPSYTFPAMIVTLFNLAAISTFHLSIYDLLRDAAQGDDTKLFQAVRLDATVLHVDSVASRIAYASLIDDRSFFDMLSKAITKTKPSLPKPHLDNTRILLAALDDAEIIEQMSVEAIRTFAVDELGLLSPEGDTHTAVRTQWRNRKNSKGG